VDSSIVENSELTRKSRFQHAKYKLVFNKLVYIINECGQFLDEPYAKYIKQKTVSVKGEIASLFRNDFGLFDNPRHNHHHLKNKFYDHAPVGFVIMNQAAGILDYNNKIRDLWGIGDGSLHGVSFFSLLEASYSIKFNQLLRELRASREDKNFECFCRRSDGRSFFARCHISVTDGSAIDSSIVLLSVLDITKELTTERIIRSIAKQASTERESDYIGHIGRLLASIEETELVVIALREHSASSNFQVYYIETDGRNFGSLAINYESWSSRRNIHQLIGSPLSEYTRQQLLNSIRPQQISSLHYDLNSYIVSENNDETLGHLTLFFKNKPKDSGLYQDILDLVAHRITQETTRYDYIKKELQIKSKLELMVAQRTKDLNEKALRLEREIEARKTIEKKLISAKQRAELSNRAKSQFLANMSHEIRTPLNGILGITSILKSVKSNKKRDEYIRIINQSGKVLLRIIDDILDLARLEAGQLKVIQADFDFRQTLQDIYHSHQSEAKKKNLRFFVLFPFNQPSRIVGDEIRIRQVIDNLVSNAIKFTESGQVVVSVRARPSKVDNTAILQVVVTDTGPGLDDNQKTIIWKRFERLDHSTTRKTDGFGLGLAITHKLLKIMKGRISLTSQVGEGSRFAAYIPIQSLSHSDLPRFSDLAVLCWIKEPGLKNLITSALGGITMSGDIFSSFEEVCSQTCDVLFVDRMGWDSLGAKQVRLIRQKIKHSQLTLYLLDDIPYSSIRIPSFAARLDLGCFLKGIEQKLTEKSPEREVERSEMLSRYSGVRILLAEDNEINQRVSTDMLKILGIEVEIAANGQQALDLFRKSNRFDLILMDCFMPEMDGVEAMTRIKRDLDPNMIIIAVTANVIKGEREKYLELGFDDYLPKPFKFSDLQEILAKYLAS